MGTNGYRADEARRDDVGEPGGGRAEDREAPLQPWAGANVRLVADHTRGPIVRTRRRLFATVEGTVEMDVTQDGRFERSDDWSSVAYFYLDRPENGLPALPPVAGRVAGL